MSSSRGFLWDARGHRSQKHVIVWFGVSCPAEIDLFGRGVKLVPEGLACSPCWKQACPFNLECIQMIDLDRIVREVQLFATSKPGRSSGPGGLTITRI